MKLLVRALVALAVLAFLAGFSGALVLRTSWFRAKVRDRVVSELERATGGRVELGVLKFQVQSLTATVSSVVLHGQETAGEPPLLRVESVALGLRILSFFERKVDLVSLQISKPLVRIVVYPDGTTNLPSPKQQSSSKWQEDLLNLRVAHYAVQDGLFEFDGRNIPLNVRGEGLDLRMSFSAQGPSYQGQFSSNSVHLVTAALAPIDVALSGSYVLDRSTLRFPRIQVRYGASSAEASGYMENLAAPRAIFTIKSALAASELGKILRLPVALQGRVSVEGDLSFSYPPGTEPFSIEFAAHATGQDLAYQQGPFKLTNIRWQGGLRLDRHSLTFNNVEASVLGATMKGEGKISDWESFRVNALVDGLDASRVASMLTNRVLPWNGIASGEIAINGLLGSPAAKVEAQLAVAPAPDGPPVEGRINITYDEAAKTLGLGSSYLATPQSRLEVSGTLGKQLEFHLQTRDPNDLLPAAPLFLTNVPNRAPLDLKNGTLTAEGTVTGTLDHPHFRGNISMTNAVWKNHAVDRLTVRADASSEQVSLQTLAVYRGATQVTGSLQLSGFATTPQVLALQGRLSVKNGNLAELSAEFTPEIGYRIPVEGLATADVSLAGTAASPEIDVTADVQNAQAYGQHFDRVRGQAKYRRNRLEVSSGEASDGAARINFAGSYQPTAGDWRRGDAAFDLRFRGLTAQRAASLARWSPQLSVETTFDGNLRGSASITEDFFRLTSADGEIHLPQLQLGHQPVGAANLVFTTVAGQLAVKASGKLREAEWEGQGSWKLDGDQPGTASFRITRMSVESAYSLAMIGEAAPKRSADLPFEGSLQASASLSVALRDLAGVDATVTLDAVELSPKQAQAAKLGVQPQDIVVRNTAPIVVSVSSKEARLRLARFSARDTNLEMAGGIRFGSTLGADLNIRGAVNLIVLQLFDSNLLARGDALLDVSIRGDLHNPSVDGRLDLRGASLFIGDLPNGLENANGTIAFNRNRATINRLTAEVGGGSLVLTGFLDFGSAVTYRLQGEAKQLRVRWPEDLSTTFDAKLALNGTPDASTLSGTLTVNRAALNLKADLAQVFAASAQPVSDQSSPNDYLRGMNFDVKVVSAPNFDFQTSLTRDVDAVIDLRLRGTPLRPSLTGTISAGAGEVRVLGSRYTINRADIRFLNAVRIEPTFDLDLETTARGVTVNITLSGTMQKLKVNYSSDPPLESREIIALLAVGRDPGANSGLAQVQAASGVGAGFVAGGGLLSQAVNEQLSSRLQRFFGATRVKIDPTLTGVSNTLQARLTFEQQVSKDITLTYMTNLNRAQEQIVRVQWDFSRNWSALAVRDANGLFGVDVQYRKRF